MTVTKKRCPIDTAMKYIGKKWSIQIVRDLFFGKTRFKDFLETNPELSTKVLSQRLKDLEKQEIITKEIVTKSPVSIEYKLTKKGESLGRILYEMARFSVKECSQEMSGKCSITNVDAKLKKTFKIS